MARGAPFDGLRMLMVVLSRSTSERALSTQNVTSARAVLSAAYRSHFTLVGFRDHVTYVEEGISLQTDVYEGRIHSGKHVHNFAFVDTAHDAFLAWNPTLSQTFHTPERFGVLEFTAR
jgi:hypothetical protein